MTVEQLAAALRHAPPATADDVTVLWDGRRIDSKEAALQWLAELAAQRAEEAAAGRGGCSGAWPRLTGRRTISCGWPSLLTATVSSTCSSAGLPPMRMA